MLVNWCNFPGSSLVQMVATVSANGAGVSNLPNSPCARESVIWNNWWRRKSRATICLIGGRFVFNGIRLLSIQLQFKFNFAVCIWMWTYVYAFLVFSTWPFLQFLDFSELPITFWQVQCLNVNVAWQRKVCIEFNKLFTSNHDLWKPGSLSCVFSFYMKSS